MGKYYRDYADFLAERFDGKVQKLAINAGFTCPNRDGSKGTGGCIYCNNHSFNPSYSPTPLDIRQQIEHGRAFFRRKYRDMRYLAYFQAYTNTYNDISPCDVKPFPKSEKFQGADVLIIGNTIIGDILKNGFQLNEDNPLRKELFTLDEIDTIRKQYGIKRVIITHLEEDWGKSYDDYRELERELNLIHFGYDGLKIQL